MRKILLFISLIALFSDVQAQTVPCLPPTSSIDLDINNVRAVIHNGGDMWMNRDISRAQYEIPKGSGIHTMFAGAIWIGGLDANGQLKLAATRFRSNGDDFWPGALKTKDGSTSLMDCYNQDKHHKMNYFEVEEFRKRYNDSNYKIPSSILNYPAHGLVEKGFAQYLAPFVDVDGDGIYNPQKGDYPAFDFNNSLDCDDKLYGHQSIWWVFNDNGNIHSETGGMPIGIEIQAQAFAFMADDEIN
ncbi:MAG: T9SS C-terminal target domain-containing protein, partial [Bacteroidetes bacterium]|nr:T9SS C-terminal target domain-containing protein [Bacteroidota bacterium]